MLGRILLVVVVLAAAAAGALWWLSAPRTLAAADLPDHAPDAENGRLVFYASGCAGCHGSQEDATALSGGESLATPLGAVAVPNISPDPDHGIGGWSMADFVNAVTRGVSPDGRWYLPAFPWPAYRDMTLTDAMDLKAFVDTLPPSDAANGLGGLAFPYSWRRPIGLWQRFAMADPPPPPSDDPQIVRGHYLTVALGHCAECHTPRNALLALEPDRWMAGAPSPDGDGRVPNITPSPDGIGGWSVGDIAYLLGSGFTPDFDSVGGEMGTVVDNWQHVPDEDRRAVAAYLKAIAGLPDAAP